MNKELVIQRYKNPANWGELKDSEVCFSSNASCGDDVTIYLEIKNDIILNCKFKASACSICVASTDLLLDRVKDLNICDVKNIKDEDLCSSLGIENNSPRKRCVTLPLEALKEALFDVK